MIAVFSRMQGKKLFKFGETNSLFRSDSDSEPSSSSEEESGDLNVNLDQGGVDSLLSITSNTGRVIKLHQDCLKGIAHHIWPAAIYFCKYLEDHKEELEKSITASFQSTIDVRFCNTPIVELGAGIGLCGIFCSKILRSPEVYLTDLDEAMPIINENISLNNSLFRVNELEYGALNAVPLDWFDRSAVKSVFDRCISTNAGISRKPIIIATDCVYFEHLFESLYHTLNEFASLGCVIIMCHVRRWKKEGKFFTMCKKTMKCETLNEDIRRVPDENTGDLRKTVTRIYKFSSL